MSPANHYALSNALVNDSNPISLLGFERRGLFQEFTYPGTDILVVANPAITTDRIFITYGGNMVFGYDLESNNALEAEYDFRTDLVNARGVIQAGVQVRVPAHIVSNNL